MRAQIDSSARCRRLLWPFDDYIIASCRLRTKSKSSARRFSASLARTSRCANLRQNRRHNPTDLSRRYRSLPCFPRLIVGLAQRSCHTQLVHHNAHHQAPAFKLLGSVDMDARPEQLLFEITVPMFLRKTPSIDTGHLCQRNVGRLIIQADKPALTWITFAVFSSLSTHLEDTNRNLASLTKMQLTPSADRHFFAVLIIVYQDRLRSIHGVGMACLRIVDHPKVVVLWGSFVSEADRAYDCA